MSYMFGRTKAPTKENERSYHISERSVSRGHLVIKVAPVKQGDGLLVHARSEITLEDSSKLGTTLNDEKFIKGSRTLSSSKLQHAFYMGSYDQCFRITWRPVVLTLQKGAAEALALLSARLERYDIKTISPYVADQTTHLISQKRNISKALQALINGKYIVTEAFVDAIVATAEPASPVDKEGEPNRSALETDYDGNWPEAIHFLPGPGKEPRPRNAELFAPDPARQNLFEGYTFIMADQTQYTTLQPPIANGAGKAVFYDMRLGVTELQEFVRYVKGVAGEKGVGELDDGGEGKGVVVVRWRSKDEALNEWVLKFIRDMDQELGLRSIEQNEFLDAILLNDASKLRQPLLDEEEEEGTGTASAAVQHPRRTAELQLPFNEPTRNPVRLKPSGSSFVLPKPPHTSSMPQHDFRSSAPASQEPSASAESQLPEDVPKSTLRHRLRRTVAQPRFKGFDDFDASQLPASSRVESLGSPVEEEDVEPFVRTQRGYESQPNPDSQSLFLREDSQPVTQINGSGKRPAPFAGEEEDEAVDAGAMVDALLPAAAAMKKRRLEEEHAGIMQPPSKPVGGLASPPAPSSKAAKKSQQLKEADVRAAAKTHAASLDARARRRDNDAEATNDAEHLDEEDISNMRNLAIVEEMEMPTRRAARNGDDDDNDNDNDARRWDERWNGRQNFKRFRKRRLHDDEASAAAARTNRARKVIVPLEEAKKKDYGIGDAYWLESSDRRQKDDKEKRRKQQSQSQAQSQSRRQSQSQSRRVDPIVLDDDDDDNDDDNDDHILPEQVAKDAGSASAVRYAADEQCTTAAKGKGKRPAAGSPTTTKPAPAKKRQTTVKAAATRSQHAKGDDDDSEEEEEEEEEAMQFKFRRER